MNDNPQPADKQNMKRPATVGAISAAIGTDVRELWIDGYTMPQIGKVIDGEMTLHQLLSTKPAGKPMTLKTGDAED